ncbi:CAP domain-containing protein [Corynebacterium sp. 21KM1197]|uniref:CAP domain-containing protein n=1 Tax=Corynebacterium sp. 21KM1197 TaxID=2989734 RepID=UPI0029CA516F|nr:CAP domain-containing protein [Corynebacterium sp. 21KM1197]WPF68188.1 CAP domain-containing protein [Corynebacterium sp. 21KM1197]
MDQKDSSLEKTAGISALAAAGVAAAAAPAAAMEAEEATTEIIASEGVEIISTEIPETSVAAEERNAQEIVDKANEIRAAHGLQELTVSEELSEGSRQWAQTLSATGTVEHAEGDFGENLHWVSQKTSTDEVMQDWMDSEHHRVNILDPESTEIGTAVVHDENGMHSVQRFF